MVLIPAGEFSMGGSELDALQQCDQWNIKGNCGAFLFVDEEPPQTVLLDNFYIDQYEVTNGSYRACVDVGMCNPPYDRQSQTRSNYYGNTAYDQYPVISVSWSDAQTYCQWRGGRLPTETEWEKAARGTEGFLYPWGNAFESGKTNFCDENCSQSWAYRQIDDGFSDTAPVGSFPGDVSPFGVFDMGGNVAEWTADWYAPYPGGNPAASEGYNETMRVRRGGSWYSLASDTRTANRDAELPEIRADLYKIYFQVGFRCVLDPVQ